MTLIAGMVAKDAVIIASDSKATESSIGNLLVDQSFVQNKLFQLGPHIVWGSSGAGGVSQRVQAMFAADHKSSAGKYLKPAAEVQAHCRSIITRSNKDEIAALPVTWQEAANTGRFVFNSFLFAGYDKSSGAAWLHEFDWCTSTSYTAQGFHAIGSGGLAALTCYKVLEHHGLREASSSIVRVVLYRIMDVCIKSSSGGLGPPIKMWEINSSDARALSEEEIRAINDTVGVWEEQERDCLQGLPSLGPENDMGG